MIPARILGTSSVLPGRRVTTEELALRLGRSPADVEAKTGIRSRHWVPKGTRSATLGADVLRLALEDAGLRPEDLRRLIFVSTAQGDQLTPANANLVAAELGIDGTSDAFDVNNACMGFLTALDLAARSAATGLSPTAIVVVEIFSDQLSPEDPRPYLVAGDATSAVIVGPGRPGEGLLGVHLGNKGAHGGTVYMPHPRVSESYVRGTFTTSNKDMGTLALDLVVKSTAAVLGESALRLEDVAWVLLHQPNGTMYEGMIRALGLDREKLVPVVQETGSTGAASIAVSLDRLRRTKNVAPGDRILMVGVGSGISYGAMIYQVAPG